MSRGETLLLLPAQRSLDLLPLRLPLGSPRRCLFGRPDSSMNTIAEEWAAQRERTIRRWDFDVVTEKPVNPPRRYLWEEVRRGEESGSPRTAASSPGKEKRESRRSERVTPYRQLRITDFWRTRKSDDQNKAKLEEVNRAATEERASGRAVSRAE